MTRLTLCLATVLVAVASVPVFAQTAGSATLVGTVTDSTGALVPGAKVVVVHTGTSFRSETTTSAEGNYTIPYLSPGTSQITLEAAGFKRYVRDGPLRSANPGPGCSFRSTAASSWS